MRFDPRRDSTWIRTRPAPFVVVDLNMIIAVSPRRGFPGTCSLVIPEILIREILQRSDGNDLADKLQTLIKHESALGRILIGTYWGDIALEETMPMRIRSNSTASIRTDFSQEFERVQRAGQLYTDTSKWPPDPDMEIGRASLLSFADRFVALMREENPAMFNWIQGHRERALHAIRDPVGSSIVAGQLVSKRFETAAWRRELCRFPDRAAVGRWLRLLFWYCLKWASAPGSNPLRFGNNYEDMHYAFLSLYTRHLWTKDAGLIEAVRAVSDNSVKIHQDPNTLP